jgi:hypothetical protein
VLVAAAAIFVGTVILRLSVGEGDEPGAVVFAPAVALLALELGLAAGIAAGLLGAVLYYVTVPEVSTWDLVFRTVALVGLGALVGALGAQLRAARRASRTAGEINDNVIQGLVLAKYAVERGDTPEAAARIDETLGEARAIVDGLVGEEAVRPGDLRRDEAARVR